MPPKCISIKMELVKPTLKHDQNVGELQVRVTGPGVSRSTLQKEIAEEFIYNLLIGNNTSHENAKHRQTNTLDDDIIHASRCPSGNSYGLDMGALCLAVGKLVWRIIVDVMVISSDGCGYLDSVQIAVKCALATTVIPKVSVASTITTTSMTNTATEAERDGETDFDLECEGSGRIDVDGVPLIVSVAKIATCDKVGDVTYKNYVIDATLAEEACSDMIILFGVHNMDRKSTVCSIKTLGSSPLLPSVLYDIIDVAIAHGNELNASINNFISKHIL